MQAFLFPGPDVPIMSGRETHNVVPTSPLPVVVEVHGTFGHHWLIRSHTRGHIVPPSHYISDIHRSPLMGSDFNRVWNLFAALQHERKRDMSVLSAWICYTCV